MKAKLKETIPSTASIRKYENRFFYCDAQSNLFDQFSNLIATDVEVQSFWFKENVLYFHDNDGSHNYLINGQTHKSDIGVFWKTISGQQALAKYDVRRENGKRSWKVGMYDLRTFRITNEFPELSNSNIILRPNENIIIGENEQKELTAWNHSGSKMWSFEKSALGFVRCVPSFGEAEENIQAQIESILGIIGNSLICQVSMFRIASISIKEGETEWMSEDMMDHDFGSFFQANIFVHSNHIYSLKLGSFFKFSLLDQKWVEKRFDQKNDSWIFDHSILFNEKLFFTGKRKIEGFSDTIGILDLATESIEWFYTFDFEPETGNFLEKEIETDGKNIWVRDSRNNLHVFEIA